MTDRYLFRGFHPCEKGTESVWIEGKEIKGKWVYGFYVDRNGMSHIHVETVDEFSQCGSWYEFVKVLPETVGQYTGKEDVHGTMIFDNDFVVAETYPYVSKVEYETKNWYMWIIENVKTQECQYFNEYDNYVVIGNIHQSPDILARKEKEE